MTRSPRVLIVVLVLMMAMACLWASTGALGHQFTAVPSASLAH
jgi:hypothetical protein